MTTTPAAPAPAKVKKPKAPATPKKGAGRPKKVPAPQSAEQVRLGQQVQEAEARREAAAAGYATSKTVAAELILLQVELEVATAWAAYLRSANLHTHSLKWADVAQKLAGRVASLRELAATDLLSELALKARRENDIARRVGGGR